MRNEEQIVQNLLKGTYSKYAVTWISECEYTLTYTEGTDKFARKIAQQLGPSRVKITDINGDIFTFVSFVFSSQYESQMQKIE